MSIGSPSPSSTSFAAPQPTALSSTSQPNDNSSSVASPLPSTTSSSLPPLSSPSTNATSPPPVASPPLPQSPPPSTIVASPPPIIPPISSPTPPSESAPPPTSSGPPASLSPPPTSSGPPASLSPPLSSTPPASSSPPPSSTTPSSKTQPTVPVSSPPLSPRTPTLSPPHSSTLPPALSPPPPVQNPDTPPAPHSPGKSSPQPPKGSLPLPPSSKPPANSPPSKPPQSSPHSSTLAPPKSSSPSPASVPHTNSSSSSSPPNGPTLPTPPSQLSPPSFSNGGQPSPTLPSPSSLSGDTTTSSNNSADRSKAAGDGDGGIGTGGTVAIGIIFALLLLGIIGAAGWCIWKRKKKDSGLSGGYILPTTLVASPKSGSASVKVQDSTIEARNGVGSNIVNSPRNPGGLGHSKPWFAYQELLEATNEFSEHNLLGEGGFGSVYKGCLADGRDVAVKKLNIGGSQGEREFRAEVEIISRIHHRHLVSLVGYCICENKRLLVYDYVPNNTLYFHLHAEGRPVMDWATRVKIAVGAARGIAYLHEDCYPRIIHRDIKSSNILLDENFEARVADFGLAKIAQDAKSHVTTRVMGTFGYMAPEYASSGKLTEKSDVFSFGVVLLELLTGRKPVDTSRPLGEESLVEWARPLFSHALEKEEFDQLADHRLEKSYVDIEMFRMIEVAAACVRHSAVKRPGMGQIIRAFDSMLMSDLTNGMKVGESTIHNSAEHSAQIRLFRRMAFPSQDFSSDFSTLEGKLAEHG